MPMVSPLKADPTKTLTLRKNFVAEMKRRFRKLRKLVFDLIVTQDAFGLNDYNPLGRNEDNPTINNRWRFDTDEAKVGKFKTWMRQAMDDEILGVRPGGLPLASPDFWTSGYVESAYRKGAVSSYLSAKRQGIGNMGSFKGTGEEFLQSAFNAKVPVSKIKLISTRAFDQLQGITDAVSQTISRELSAAIAHGDGPRVVAKRITDAIGSIERKRALAMARTEIIHAHAEGQLDSFEAQDIDDVEVLSEWSTAGDDRVCFPKFTLVHNGSENVPIESMPETALTRHGTRKVRDFKTRLYTGWMVTLRYGDREITATEGHPLWIVGKGWIQLGWIGVGNYLLDIDGVAVEVENVSRFEVVDLPVYNMEVEEYPEYYANGILVHNCELCGPMEGVTLTVKEARGLIPRHVNCVAADMRVVAPEVLAMCKTNFTGEVIDLTTEGGRKITVTLAHVLLTEYGFARAESVYSGLNLVKDDGFYGSSKAPNYENNVASIADEFKAASEAFGVAAVSVPTSPEDLHNEGRFCDEKIDIVFSDSVLGCSVDPHIRQSSLYNMLPFCNGGVERSAMGTLAQRLVSVANATDSSMGLCRDALAFLLGCVFEAKQVSGGAAARNYAGICKPFVDDTTDRAELLSQCIDRHPTLVQINNLTCVNLGSILNGCVPNGASGFDQTGLDRVSLATVMLRNFVDRPSMDVVQFDKVVSVERRHVKSFPVYDLQTTSTLYSIEGIITSNCRCSWVPSATDQKGKGKKRTKKQIESAISKSIKAEHPKASKKNAKAETEWLGADKTIAKTRPEFNESGEYKTFVINVQTCGVNETIRFRAGAIDATLPTKDMIDGLYLQNQTITANGREYTGSERKLRVECLHNLLASVYDVVDIKPEK